MIKCIFEICTLWKKEICQNEELKDLYRLYNVRAKLSERLDDSLLNSFNRICSECKFPLVIVEKECPVCANRDLRLGITEGQRGLNLIFSYNCEQCGRALYSDQRFD